MALKESLHQTQGLTVKSKSKNGVEIFRYYRWTRLERCLGYKEVANRESLKVQQRQRRLREFVKRNLNTCFFRLRRIKCRRFISNYASISCAGITTPDSWIGSQSSVQTMSVLLFLNNINEWMNNSFVKVFKFCQYSIIQWDKMTLLWYFMGFGFGITSKISPHKIP